MKLKNLALITALWSGLIMAQTESAPASYGAVGIDRAWARGYTGAGSRVAVIDSGFALDHRDISGQVLLARNFYNYGAVTWGTHGTAMASIIAGTSGNSGMVGVAPQAKLILAQIGPGQSSSALSATALDQALLWASGSGADIINLSLGYNYTPAFTNVVVRDQQSGAYMVNAGLIPGITAQSALTQASKTSVLVVSAGNQGLPYASFPAQYAARTDVNGNLLLGGRMLIVGSVTDAGVITSWSNRAGHICVTVAAGTCQDTMKTTDFFVVAPGVNITAAQATANTTVISGTSPSAALVSGGMALMRQAWPQLRPEQLVQLVLTTTRDLGAPGTDLIYGRGMVDFDRASRPQGAVRVAQASQVLGRTTATSGFVSAGTDVADSRILARNGFMELFSTSRVLKSVQVIDDYDRNYSADFARAIGLSPMLYNPDSAWLPASQRLRLPVSEGYQLVVDQAATGISTQLEYMRGAWTYQIQLGSMSEATGYLGNAGSGALSLGSSNTAWTAVGIERALTQKISMLAQYGQGRTTVTNSAVSLIQTDPVLQSQSWRVGLRYRGWLSDKDSVHVNLAEPVHVTRGSVKISAVTDYNHAMDADGNVIAMPKVSTETVDLAKIKTQRVMALSYQQEITNRSKFNLSMTLQHSGYRMGMNYNYMFN